MSLLARERGSKHHLRARRVGRDCRSSRGSADRNADLRIGADLARRRSSRGSADRNPFAHHLCDFPPQSLLARERGSKRVVLDARNADESSLLARERGSKLLQLVADKDSRASLLARERGSKHLDPRRSVPTAGRSSRGSADRNMHGSESRRAINCRSSRGSADRNQ